MGEDLDVRHADINRAVQYVLDHHRQQYNEHATDSWVALPKKLEPVMFTAVRIVPNDPLFMADVEFWEGNSGSETSTGAPGVVRHQLSHSTATAAAAQPTTVPPPLMGFPSTVILPQPLMLAPPAISQGTLPAAAPHTAAAQPIVARQQPAVQGTSVFARLSHANAVNPPVSGNAAGADDMVVDAKPLTAQLSEDMEEDSSDIDMDNAAAAAAPQSTVTASVPYCYPSGHSSLPAGMLSRLGAAPVFPTSSSSPAGANVQPGLTVSPLSQPSASASISGGSGRSSRKSMQQCFAIGCLPVKKKHAVKRCNAIHANYRRYADARLEIIRDGVLFAVETNCLTAAPQSPAVNRRPAVATGSILTRPLSCVTAPVRTAAPGMQRLPAAAAASGAMFAAQRSSARHPISAAQAMKDGIASLAAARAASASADRSTAQPAAYVHPTTAAQSQAAPSAASAAAAAVPSGSSPTAATAAQPSAA